jgi:hypothetical protein
MWAGEEVDAKWERPRQIRAMGKRLIRHYQPEPDHKSRLFIRADYYFKRGRVQSNHCEEKVGGYG